MKSKYNLLDFEIDKLTNSIENTLTGEIFDTEISKITDQDRRLIKKSDWLFDWRIELQAAPQKEVFKLTTVNNSGIIQGLICLEDKKDHIFIHLLESADFNKGKRKMYVGGAGNLVAYACKVSFEKGYEGFVAFDSKTADRILRENTRRKAFSRAKNVYRNARRRATRPKIFCII